MKTIDPRFHARPCDCGGDIILGGHGAHWTDEFYICCAGLPPDMPSCGAEIRINIHNPLWEAAIRPLWNYLHPILDVKCKCGKEHCVSSMDLYGGKCQRHGPPGTKPGTADPITENHHQDGSLFKPKICGWVSAYDGMEHD